MSRNDPFLGIADRIREAAARAGLTQRELARRAGMAPTQISVILHRLTEHPYAIELETLARIAQGAEVSLLWLIAGVESSPGPLSPRLADDPDWPLVRRATARAMPQLSPKVWDWAGEVRFPAEPRVALTPPLLQALAMIAWHQLPYEQTSAIPEISRRPQKRRRKPADAAKQPKRRA